MVNDNSIFVGSTQESISHGIEHAPDGRVPDEPELRNAQHSAQQATGWLGVVVQSVHGPAPVPPHIGHSDTALAAPGGSMPGKGIFSSPVRASSPVTTSENKLHPDQSGETGGHRSELWPTRYSHLSVT